MKEKPDVPTLIKEGQRLLSQGDEEGAHDRFLEAGQELYDRHRNRMLAKCTWRFGDTGKDLVQEVFQLLWEKMPELEHPETVEGWLYGVRDNKMLQMGRNAGRRKSIEEEKQGPHCRKCASCSGGVSRKNGNAQREGSRAPGYPRAAFPGP